MPSIIQQFVAEIRAMPGGAAVAADIAHLLDELDVEAAENQDSAALFAATEWILVHGPSMDEKLEQLQRLVRLKGKVAINMRDFTGWR
jgi:hypothetical protein